MKKTKKRLSLSSETLRRVVGGATYTETCPFTELCPTGGCPPDTNDLRCTRVSKWFFC